MPTDLVIEKSAGIAWVTLNRPAVKNALTFAMCAELTAFFRGLATDTGTRVVALRGSGTDFCSGADLNDVATLLAPSRDERRAAASQQVRELAWPLFLAMHAARQPIVSSVRGYAVGAGAQFALCSDLVMASESARWVFPQVKLGHSVDHGESWFLPRRIGLPRATQLLLLGDTLNAADAERFGLANWVVPDAALEEKTEELLRRLAASATVAVAEIKGLLRHSLEQPLEVQLEAEAQALGTCAATDDFAEAIGAFMAKRRPTFTGR